MCGRLSRVNGGASLRQTRDLDLLFDQVRQRLRVGLGGEFVALRDQFPAQVRIVLDDAVMDDGKSARAVAMWMRIQFAWTPMCGPARMSDSNACGNARLIDHPRQYPFKIGDLAGCPHHIDLFAVRIGDSGGIVPSIFQAFQVVDGRLDGQASPNISGDPTHGIVLFHKRSYDSFAAINSKRVPLRWRRSANSDNSSRCSIVRMSVTRRTIFPARIVPPKLHGWRLPSLPLSAAMMISGTPARSCFKNAASSARCENRSSVPGGVRLLNRTPLAPTMATLG